MTEIAARYEQIVEEETERIGRIKTCEAYINALLEYTYHNGDQHHRLTVEDILTAVFTMGSHLRTELLHVQFEKAMLSCRMKSR
jgi:hypothetical protein